MPRSPQPTALTLAVDLAVVTPHHGQLAVLVQRPAPRGRTAPALPWGTPARGETLDAAARRIARDAIGATGGRDPWLEQVIAVHDARAHPSRAAVSVGYVALAPAGTLPPGDAAAWQPLSRLSGLPARQGDVARAALTLLRRRLDDAPVAFRLLPPTFTLTELQQVYELLLGQPLHKASFRRALDAAGIVRPTDAWRSEGRGRPAQLFRFAPQRTGRRRRAVRFDLDLGVLGSRS